MSAPARRSRGSRGVATAEAVFVIPVLFLFLWGLFDVGQWVFQTTQSTAAARDGARAGIVPFTSAGGTTAAPGGAGFTVINDAVRARLVGQTYTVTVVCVGPGDEVVKPCATATPDSDRISVTVQWSRSPLTSVTSPFGTRTVQGKAIMRVVGQPQ